MLVPDALSRARSESSSGVSGPFLAAAAYCVRQASLRARVRPPNTSPPSVIFSGGVSGRVMALRSGGSVGWVWPKFAGVARPPASFPRAWQRGKVTHAMSEVVAIQVLMIAEYFANRLRDLVKWQSGKVLGNFVVSSLHSLHAMQCNDLQCSATTCNALQRPAMHCNDLQCIATTCNALQSGYVQ